VSLRNYHVRAARRTHLVDEQVLRLEVPVQHAVLVAVRNAAEELEHQLLPMDKRSARARR